MSMIRMRPDENLVVGSGFVAPAQAGGFVVGEGNSLLEPSNTADVSALKVAPITHSETAAAALRETLAARALRGYEYSSIPEEEGFDATTALGDKAAHYNEDELEFLGESRSSTEMAQRLSQVELTRNNFNAMAAHPLTAIAGSLFDADAVIGLGVGKLTGLARSTRMVAALGANAAVLGLANEGGEVTALDVIGSSLGVALSAVPTVSRPIAALDDVVPPPAALDEVPPQVVPDTPPATPPVVPPTTAADDVPPAVVPPTAGLDEVPVVPPRTEKLPDVDYIKPVLDTQTTKEMYVNVGPKKGQVQILTDMRNVLGATLANLSDEVPDGVRRLGVALWEGMQQDDLVPAVFRQKSKSSRDNVRLNHDGTMLGTLYADRAPDLASTVKNMSAYDQTILMHEAAHAKTIRNIAAFERGTLKQGAVYDAVKRIDEIRQYVAGRDPAANLHDQRIGGPAYNIRYGLKNNHEFISQLFNSEDFRTALQGITMPGPKKTAWSNLVEAVVSAFTGRPPRGSAFDELVSEFEKLVALPADESALTKATAKAEAPSLQSPSLQGATVEEVANKVGKVINRNLALYDRIVSFGNKAAALADRLVIDATGSAATSAVHYARTAHLAANVAMAQVDRTISQALSERGWNVFSRVRNPNKFREAQRELSAEVYTKIAENHRVFREGGTVTPHSDPAIERIVQSFASSKWAEDSLARIKASGMTGSEFIDSSPWYLPRRHSGNRVNDFLRANPNVTRADVEGMYAQQFKRMFAEQGIEDATAKALGRSMLRNMEERASGVQGWKQHIAGLSNDDIEFAMRNAGIEEDKIQQFLGVVDKAGEQSNTVRNLRRRVDFDMTLNYKTKSGQAIYPELFVDKDVMGLMEGYSRNMSGRIGLAKAGFPDLRPLSVAVDEAVAEAGDVRAARQTLDDTVNQLLGYPTGEDVPDILRSFSVLSGAVQLANSGIFQLADTALLLKQFGVAKVLRGMSSTEWGRSGLALAQSQEFGSRLRDVLEARHVLQGRFRTTLTHLEDNTDIGSIGLAHQTIQQWGQSTRFVNGMEFVRRGQSKLMAGLVADTFDDAIRGNAGAVEALKRFGMTDDLLRNAKAAMDADPDLRTWPDNIRLDIETVAHNMGDALVLENRLGEIPAWMQFSALGKFIMPYMSFVAGSWNKILRRTIRQEGAQGIALMLAYQLPLQVVASTAALAGSQQEMTPENLTANILTQLPLMSWMGFGVNMLTQGPSNSIAALGIVDKAFSATSGILSGEADAEQIIRATPFISILPGIRIMAKSMTDEE